MNTRSSGNSCLRREFVADPQTLLGIPGPIIELTHLMASTFFSDVDSIVIFALSSKPYVSESDLSAKLMLMPKVLRASLANLKRFEIIDSAQRPGTASSSNKNETYYWLKYNRIVNMVNYIAHQMENEMGNKRNNLTPDQISFVCTNKDCGLKFKEDQIGEIFDPEDICFRCFICKGDIKDIREEMCVAQEQTMKEFNEMMDPFLKLLSKCRVTLAPKLLNPLMDLDIIFKVEDD